MNNPVSRPGGMTRMIALPALLALALTVLVASGLTQVADTLLLSRATGLVRDARLREALRDITALGSFTVLGLAVAGASGYLVARGRWRIGAVLLVSALGATAASSVLKFLIDRARPEPGTFSTLTFTASFPSGHAFLSAAILLTIAGILAFAARQPHERRFIFVFAILLTGMIGLSRVLLGVHWPSDVLAGWCFGTAWAAGTFGVTRGLMSNKVAPGDMAVDGRIQKGTGQSRTG